MTISEEQAHQLEVLICQSIPHRQKDCPVERARKEYARKELKKKIIEFINTLK